MLTNVKSGIGLTYSVFPMRSDAVADFADLPGTTSCGRGFGAHHWSGCSSADLPQPAKLIIGIAKESGLGGSSFTSNVAFLAFVDGIVGVRVVVVTERRAGGEAYNRGVATALAPSREISVCESRWVPRAQQGWITSKHALRECALVGIRSRFAQR